MSHKNIIVNKNSEIAKQYHDELDAFVGALESKFDKLYQSLHRECEMTTGHNFYSACDLHICKYCGYNKTK